MSRTASVLLTLALVLCAGCGGTADPARDPGVAASPSDNQVDQPDADALAAELEADLADTARELDEAAQDMEQERIEVEQEAAQLKKETEAELAGPTIENSIGMELALIPAGEFLMGSPDGDSDADDDEKPQHTVRITKPFYLGVTAVTQEQYERVMGTNPSEFKGAELPVERVSWEDAMEFCRKLSAVAGERSAGRVYRLPTEAEWEYACRAGSKTKWSFGDDESELRDHAWYDDNSDGKTHPVGQKKPNAWGLYDMHGNVREWCSDYWKRDYTAMAVSDPTGPAAGSYRVHRGGCWSYFPRHCRSASRGRRTPGSRGYYLGFRLAFSSVDQSGQ